MVYVEAHGQVCREKLHVDIIHVNTAKPAPEARLLRGNTLNWHLKESFGLSRIRPILPQICGQADKCENERA